MYPRLAQHELWIPSNGSHTIFQCHIHHPPTSLHEPPKTSSTQSSPHNQQHLLTASLKKIATHWRSLQTYSIRMQLRGWRRRSTRKTSTRTRHHPSASLKNQNQPSARRETPRDAANHRRLLKILMCSMHKQISKTPSRPSNNYKYQLHHRARHFPNPQFPSRWQHLSPLVLID